MVVNKGAASAPATVTLANVAHGAASEVWQLHTHATSRESARRLRTLPAQSVTLFVIPRGTTPTGPPAAPTGVRIIP